MAKLRYLSVFTLSNRTPAYAGTSPRICRHVTPREQLLNEIHHGDGWIAVRGDLLEEQVDHLTPAIYGTCANLGRRVSAPTHFLMLMGFRALPDLPILQTKTALPGFGRRTLRSDECRIKTHIYV
jgi:hypothetical protein